ncbi:hypothetical protein C1H46_008605 [Malus baccata]|uniref:Uncharacterized protein n=1 Tax=Malus baccata TaxID=106549 RepID=A0A540N3Z8_MALBA|nr:hypothetical protein C1H46_008605 [Malus baccata]
MLVGLVLVMFLGIAVYLLLCTIDYSISSDEGDLLKRQFDLASRETMDESAEWRLKYDEEAEKATKCMNKLKQKKGSFGEGDGNAATINQKLLNLQRKIWLLVERMEALKQEFEAKKLNCSI